MRSLQVTAVTHFSGKGHTKLPYMWGSVMVTYEAHNLMLLVQFRAPQLIYLNYGRREEE